MYKQKLDKDIRCPLEYGLEIFFFWGGGKMEVKNNLCISKFWDS